jgi:hypothetical protein
MATVKYYNSSTSQWETILYGAQGATGDTGPGVATGGTTGQYLVKVDGTNYNTQWSTLDLSGKQNVVTDVSDTEIGYLNGVTSNIQTQLNAKATPSDITTAINNLVDGAPAALDTLNELAAAVNDDSSFASTVTTALGTKAPIASPTFTGTPVLGAATATSINGTTIPSTKTLVVTTDKLNVHAATTSAELAGVISDETGSGALVFGTSPTIATPNITRPVILAQGGTEGGEIQLNSPPSGTAIATGVNIDIAGNALRFFEAAGTTRGMTIDITTLGAGATSGIATTDTAQTFSNKLIADATTTTAARGAGYMGVPQSAAATTGAYTIVAADAGEHIYSTATRTVTIPANSSVAFPIGTAITFIAATGTTVTIAITSDTLLLAGPGTTGSRTLAPFGMATAIKITSTSWIISGNGLT